MSDDGNDEVVLPSDKVPAALDKTNTDMEHDIKFMVEEARTAALANNLFLAESLLKRVVKQTSLLRGPTDMQLAAHLSKLAAVQQQFNKTLESKLNWNRALYIWEMNRAAEEYDPKDKKTLQQTVLQLDGPVNNQDSKFDRPDDLAEDPPTIAASKPKRQLIPLQKLFKIPHFSMQSADASIINTQPIYMEDLTPRTRQVIKERGVDPNHLRIRDVHSFYSAAPKMPILERRQRFVKWAKRREWLQKELLEDRYVIQLTFDSQDRLDRMEKEFNEMKARRKAKIFGLDKGTNFDASGVTRSILPAPHGGHKFKGSVAAAIDARRTPLSTPMEKMRPKRQDVLEDAPVLCPACATPWDFKQTPCRVCNKKIDWTKYQQEAHQKSRDLKNMLDRKFKLRKIRKKKEDQEQQRLLDVALKIAQQKADALKWQKERLLRQRQAKKRKKDGIDEKIHLENEQKSNQTKLIINPRTTSNNVVDMFKTESKNTNGRTSNKNVLAAFMNGSDTTNTTNTTNTTTNNTTNRTLPLVKSPNKKKGYQEFLQEKEKDLKDLKDSESKESSQEELVQASRNVYVEAQPAGYAFPLLSVYAERDHGMRMERMKNPELMSSEENLLRTLDKLTRNEVNRNGFRNRKNQVAVRRKSRNKKFTKRLFMYDMDHEKPKPKYPDAVGNKEFVFDVKKKKIPQNWVDIHGKTKVKDAKKAEHFLEQLHAEQVAETLRSQEIAKVQANGDHRRQLKLYTLMKAAESQDKVIDLMDDAGMLSMPQLIAHVQKSVRMDHVIETQMKVQRV